ncbi:MAG: hypothetical protein VX424_02860 [Actinomycetota bacterium]|nr:hypothetical protein [Actinomycetota bacterium]
MTTVTAVAALTNPARTRTGYRSAATKNAESFRSSAFAVPLAAEVESSK